MKYVRVKNVSKVVSKIQFSESLEEIQNKIWRKSFRNKKLRLFFFRLIIGQNFVKRRNYVFLSMKIYNIRKPNDGSFQCDINFP